MSPYNIHQQVYVLSQASNILSSCVGSQDDLQQKISSALPPIIASKDIGDWKVVWGPTVWKLLPNDVLLGPSHTWYIAHNPAADFGDGTHDTYVVATAGTADHSIVNFLEDLNVVQVVDFNAWVQTALSEPPQPAKVVDTSVPYVSQGTAFGVYTLLNVKGPDGTTLAQFLSALPPSSRVIFTGHSLAGALSPTLALSVVSTGILKIPVANVFTYPTAGPSPGNKPFANLYATTFPLISVGSNPYQVWNANIWNHYDLVPHAWNVVTVSGQNLADIPLLYGILPLQLFEQVTGSVAAAIGLATKSGITYVPLRGSKLSPSQPPSPKTWKDFLKNVGTQHIDAYRLYLEVPEVPPLCGKPEPTEAATQLPVVQILHHAKLASDVAADA